MRVGLFCSWDDQCGIAVYSGFLKRSLLRAGVGVTAIAFNKKKSFFSFVRLAMRTHDIDIAHIQHEFGFFGSNFFESVLNTWIFIKFLRVPAVVTIHELALPAQQGILFSLRRFILFSAQRRLFAGCAALVVHSEVMREQLLAMDFSPERITVAVHPIPDRADFHVSEQGAFERIFPGGKPVVTIFGFVVQRKGYETILAAAEKFDACTYLVVGGRHPGDCTNYFARFKEEIKKRGLSHRIILTGYIPKSRIPAIMDGTDIVLAPYNSIFASGSLSIAVAFHKPILSSDVAYFLELKRLGAGIEIFKAGDADDFVLKLGKILSDLSLKQALQRSSADFARLYGYAYLADLFNAVYVRILSKKE